MREQFEKLPKIAAELENSDGELYWCDKQNQYRNNRVFQDSQTGWMNGAWYAFQEQQEKIARLQSRVDGAMDFYNTAKSDVNIGMMRMAQYLKGEVK